MFGFAKKETSVDKPKSYTVKTTVIKGRDKYNIYDEYTVTVEGSGFTGTATAISLSSAFEKAFGELMNEVSQTIFKDG